jgi:hypothetical protein
MNCRARLQLDHAWVRGFSQHAGDLMARLVARVTGPPAFTDAEFALRKDAEVRSAPARGGGPRVATLVSAAETAAAAAAPPRRAASLYTYLEGHHHDEAGETTGNLKPRRNLQVLRPSSKRHALHSARGRGRARRAAASAAEYTNHTPPFPGCTA